MSSSGGRQIADRLKAFADRFAALGRPARPASGGYAGLAGDDLSAPLVSSHSQGGDVVVGGGGATGYAPPGREPRGDAGAGAAVHLPTQVGGWRVWARVGGVGWRAQAAGGAGRARHRPRARHPAAVAPPASRRRVVIGR